MRKANLQAAILAMALILGCGPAAAQPVPTDKGGTGAGNTATDDTIFICNGTGCVNVAIPDCDGANECILYDADTNTISCDTSCGGGSAGHTIKDEGTPLAARAGLNFVGDGVGCADDAGNDETDCTIPGIDGEKTPTDDYFMAGDGADWQVVALPATPCSVWEQPVWITATNSWGCGAWNTTGIVDTAQLADGAATDAKVSDGITVNLESGGVVKSPSYPSERACFSAGAGVLTPSGPCTDDDVPEAGDYSNLTGGAGIDHTTTGTVAVDLLASGSDGDSATTGSDSGLEFVGGKLTLFRGCDDGEVPTWNETSDTWECGAGGGIAVENSDVSKGTGIGTLDFGNGFVVTISPVGEANISLTNVYQPGTKILPTDMPDTGTYNQTADVQQITTDPDSANDPVRKSYADYTRCWVHHFSTNTGNSTADVEVSMGGTVASTFYNYQGGGLARDIVADHMFCGAGFDAPNGENVTFTLGYRDSTGAVSDGASSLTSWTGTALACTITGTSGTSDDDCTDTGPVTITADPDRFILVRSSIATTWTTAGRNFGCSIEFCTVDTDD